jgi:hypothetical protein
MPLAARLFIVLLFVLAVIGLWRLPRSDGPARPPIKFAVSAQLERSMRGAWCTGFAEGAVTVFTSALPPRADMCGATRDVRFGPIADILQISLENKNPRLRVPGASGISNAEGSRQFEYAPES